MAIFILDESNYFPPVVESEPDGLLAIGGDLSPARLLQAYRSGIFPWYDQDPILWWSPDPRFVLYPENLKVSKSMRPVLNQGRMSFTINKAFRKVMENCRSVKREHQDNTWINSEMINAYTTLHEMGFAFSAEAWVDNQLAGGLYGVWMGNVFFGESMFSLLPNASKFAFINWVQYLKSKSVILIDCQVYTAHLESLGAKMIVRENFINILKDNLD